MIIIKDNNTSNMMMTCVSSEVYVLRMLQSSRDAPLLLIFTMEGP